MLRVALLAVLVPTVAFAASVPVDVPYGDDDGCRTIDGISEGVLVAPDHMAQPEIWCSFNKPVPLKRAGKAFIAYCAEDTSQVTVTFEMAKQKDGTFVYSDDLGGTPGFTAILHRCP